jgi:hypothetical protein
MKEDDTSPHSDNVIRGLGTIVPLLPSILLKSGGAYLRFKKDAKRAGTIFYKELRRQGIEEHMASELTQMYLESSSILRSVLQRR